MNERAVTQSYIYISVYIYQSACDIWHITEIDVDICIVSISWKEEN